MKDLYKDYSDLDLQNLVLEENNRQLNSIKKSSLLNALISLDIAKDYIEKEEVLNFDKYSEESKFISESLTNLENLVKKKDPEKFFALREKLHYYKNLLESYIVEVSFVGELIDEEGIKYLAQDKNNNGVKIGSLEEIINFILKTLDKSKDNYNKYIFIISELIKALPMRMVRSNYNYLVEETLKRNLSRYNENTIDMYIENYKKQFYSGSKDGYGLDFDYFFVEIEQIKRENISSLKLQDLSFLVDKTINLTNELNILRDVFVNLGIISNYIYVSYFEEENRKQILEQWYKEKRSTVIKKYQEELEEIETRIQDSLKNYEKLSLELARRKDFDSKSLEKELLTTRDLLVYYNDLYFTDRKYLENKDFKKAKSNYIENSVLSLIEYMDRYSKDMTNLERKIRMRKLLSILELPFENLDKFVEYIRYSLDEKIISKDIINFKLRQIVFFLNEL